MLGIVQFAVVKVSDLVCRWSRRCHSIVRRTSWNRGWTTWNCSLALKITVKTSSVSATCSRNIRYSGYENSAIFSVHTQPFYGPLSLTTQVGQYQKRHSPTHSWNVLWESVIILDFMRRGEDIRGKCADMVLVSFLLRNRLHLCDHKYVLNKERDFSTKRRSFLVVVFLTLWNNLPAGTADFMSA